MASEREAAATTGGDWRLILTGVHVRGAEMHARQGFTPWRIGCAENASR
jgi:hypothetical protein